MKGVIAAGGKGTRLRPITHTMNKHLIPLANKPMIVFVIEKLKKAGITNIGIVRNPGDMELPSVLGDGQAFGVSLTYIDQMGGALGVAHVVKSAKSFIGDEDFVFFLGDNILLGDITHLIHSFQGKKVNCQLALSQVPDPNRFGVAQIKDGKIVSIEEKPRHPKSSFAVTGIYIYDHHIFEAIHALKPSARGEYEISEAHQYLIDHGYTIGYEEITGWWKDTGKPQDLLEGNSLLLSQMTPMRLGSIDETVKVFGNVRIGEHTEIKKDTVIRGPVVIGNHCVIEKSYIGPYTSIGDNVQIKETEIEHSIVFSGSHICCPIRIIDSLIGLNSSITSKQERRPLGHKIIIGENTTLEI